MLLTRTTQNTKPMSDPGINTDIRFRLHDGAGAIVFTNTNGIKPQELTACLLREAENLYHRHDRQRRVFGKEPEIFHSIRSGSGRQWR